jgi:hypothetical protein
MLLYVGFLGEKHETSKNDITGTLKNAWTGRTHDWSDGVFGSNALHVRFPSKFL